MNNAGILLTAALCIPLSVLADVPVYRDQALSIDEALVVTASGTRYYKDIKLSANPDGSFKLVQAERLDPAHVDNVKVKVDGTTSTTVNVEVTGYLPNPCFEIQEPAVMREGSTFTVVVAQKALQTFVVCAQVIEPFSVVVSLSVEGLPAGHYDVVVNGRQAGFDLAANQQVSNP